MEIDSSTIKNLRTQRSWTQQHLADACDISLRTVLYQRDQVYSCKARILTNITLLCLVGYR